MISKYKEIINYLIFGVLTTTINLLTYYLLVPAVLNPNNNLELQLANTLSWITSVTFAYITNKLYVFNSKNNKIIKEIIKFYSSRLSTLLLDMFLMYIFIIKLNLNDKIIKIIVAIIIIILNYFISKIIVFKKKSNY